MRSRVPLAWRFASITPTVVSDEDRSAALDGAVLNATRSGWRTISRTGTQAQLIKGKPVNHVLHLILTLITLGTWILVWIPLSLIGGEKQRLLSVDTAGVVSG